MGSAGCLGCLLPWLPEEELSPVLHETVLQDDLSLDWSVRHGRSSTISVLLSTSPTLVYPDHAVKLQKVLLAHLAADRVPIASNGVRSVGFLLAHCLSTAQPTPVDLVTPFLKSMNHASNDVKVLVAMMTSHMAHSQPAMLATDLLKPFLPMLLNGTMEKNSMVKSCSETALVDLLHMRKGPAGQTKALALLDSGARDSLSDIVSRTLTKLAQQPEGREAVLDDTILA